MWQAKLEATARVHSEWLSRQLVSAASANGGRLTLPFPKGADNADIYQEQIASIAARQNILSQPTAAPVHQSPQNTPLNSTNNVKFHSPVATSTEPNTQHATTPAAKIETFAILDASNMSLNTTISSHSYSFATSLELYRGTSNSAKLRALDSLASLMRSPAFIEDEEDLVATDEVTLSEKTAYLTQLNQKPAANPATPSLPLAAALVADLLHASRDDIMPNPNQSSFQGQSRKILGNIEKHHALRNNGGAELWELTIAIIAHFTTRSGGSGKDGGVKRYWAPMFVNPPPAVLSEDDEVDIEEERRRMIRKVAGVLNEAVVARKERHEEEEQLAVEKEQQREQEQAKEKAERSSRNTNTSAALSNYDEFGEDVDEDDSAPTADLYPDGANKDDEFDF